MYCGSKFSSHEVGSTNTGSQGGGEFLGSFNAVESPLLGHWGCEGTGLEFWIESVCVGSLGWLAWLNSKSGSISQELVGWTATHGSWLQKAYWSCLLGSISILWWEFTSGTGCTISWRSGKNYFIIRKFRCSNDFFISNILGIPSVVNLLSNSIFDTLAVGKCRSNLCGMRFNSCLCSNCCCFGICIKSWCFGIHITCSFSLNFICREFSIGSIIWCFSKGRLICKECLEILSMVFNRF